MSIQVFIICLLLLILLYVIGNFGLKLLRNELLTKDVKVRTTVWSSILFGLSLSMYISLYSSNKSVVEVETYDHDVRVVIVEDEEYKQLVTNYLTTNGLEKVDYEMELYVKYDEMYTKAEKDYKAKYGNLDFRLILRNISIVYGIYLSLTLIYTLYIAKYVGTKNEIKEKLLEEIE